MTAPQNHQFLSNMYNSKNFIIAIDGCSAVGKGTLAQKLAKFFHCDFLPTGNLYRLLAKTALEASLNLEDTYAVSKLVPSLDLASLNILVLSDPAIAKAASLIATEPKIREELNQIQRNWVAKQKVAIIEGRDIGSKICPDANIKFFLTASVEARALRRFRELQSLGKDVILSGVEEQLVERDRRDSERSASPLIKAEDAIEVDTTNMSADEVFNFVLSRIREKMDA